MSRPSLRWRCPPRPGRRPSARVGASEAPRVAGHAGEHLRPSEPAVGKDDRTCPGPRAGPARQGAADDRRAAERRRAHVPRRVRRRRSARRTAGREHERPDQRCQSERSVGVQVEAVLVEPVPSPARLLPVGDLHLRPAAGLVADRSVDLAVVVGLLAQREPDHVRTPRSTSAMATCAMSSRSCSPDRCSRLRRSRCCRVATATTLSRCRAPRVGGHHGRRTPAERASGKGPARAGDRVLRRGALARRGRTERVCDRVAEDGDARACGRDAIRAESRGRHVATPRSNTTRARADLIARTVALASPDPSVLRRGPGRHRHSSPKPPCGPRSHTGSTCTGWSCA